VSLIGNPSKWRSSRSGRSKLIQGLPEAGNWPLEANSSWRWTLHCSYESQLGHQDCSANVQGISPTRCAGQYVIRSIHSHYVLKHAWRIKTSYLQEFLRCFLDQMHEELMEPTHDVVRADEEELESVSEVESNNDDAKSYNSDEQVWCFNSVMYAFKVMLYSLILRGSSKILISQKVPFYFWKHRVTILSTKLQTRGFPSRAVTMEVGVSEREHLHFSVLMRREFFW